MNMSTFRSMQQTLVARAAATRSQPQVASLRDDLRDRARSSRRQELLANLRALRACAQRARLRKSSKLALLRRNKPSAKVLTIFTILALARPTSSPNHLHQSRLRPPDILAFIASTTAATISSARALSASSFTQPTFAHSIASTIAATISTTLATVTAAITTAGASAGGWGMEGTKGVAWGLREEENAEVAVGAVSGGSAGEPKAAGGRRHGGGGLVRSLSPPPRWRRAWLGVGAGAVARAGAAGAAAASGTTIAGATGVRATGVMAAGGRAAGAKAAGARAFHC